MKNTTVTVAALAAALFLVGCGDGNKVEPDHSDSARKVMEKRIADVKARQASLLEQGNAAEQANTASDERDQELEARAAEIDAAYEADAGNGPHSKNVSRTMPGIIAKTSTNKPVVFTTTYYFATASDGKAWRATVTRKNGVVTRAEKEDNNGE